ncbi:MAG: hypothetical protein HOY76_21450 [Streptomyces sp.]|nr:hypothetical protein [Streptomyces sp.]
MNQTTRYECPLDCGWHHDRPTLPDMTGVSGATAEEVAFAVLKRDLQEAEAVLQEHFEQHPLTEWVLALVAARQERDTAVAELRTDREQAQIVRDWMQTAAASR